MQCVCQRAQHLLLSFIKMHLQKQESGHFGHFWTADQFEILQGVREHEGAVSVKATGWTPPTSQPGNQLLSLFPAVLRIIACAA